MMAKIVRQVEAEPDYHVQLEVNRPQPDATVSDAISCAIRRVSRILPVAVLVNYTESGNSTLRAARERPGADPQPDPEPAHRAATDRGLGRVFGGQRATGARRRDLLDRPRHRPGPAHGAPRRTVVVTAGVPFGRPGSTNMLRIETVAPPLGGL